MGATIRQGRHDARKSSALPSNSAPHGSDAQTAAFDWATSFAGWNSKQVSRLQALRPEPSRAQELEGVFVSIKADKWIRRMALEHKMIEPFVDDLVQAA